MHRGSHVHVQTQRQLESHQRRGELQNTPPAAVCLCVRLILRLGAAQPFNEQCLQEECSIDKLDTRRDLWPVGNRFRLAKASIVNR